MTTLLETIFPTLNKSQLIISVAAAVPLAYLQDRLSSDMPLIRAMPNTCVSVEAV